MGQRRSGRDAHQDRGGSDVASTIFDAQMGQCRAQEVERHALGRKNAERAKPYAGDDAYCTYQLDATEYLFEAGFKAQPVQRFDNAWMVGEVAKRGRDRD